MKAGERRRQWQPSPWFPQKSGRRREERIGGGGDGGGAGGEDGGGDDDDGGGGGRKGQRSERVRGRMIGGRGGGQRLLERAEWWRSGG